jgi:hypothetical protein
MEKRGILAEGDLKSPFARLDQHRHYDRMVAAIRVESLVFGLQTFTLRATCEF